MYILSSMKIILRSKDKTNKQTNTLSESKGRSQIISSEADVDCRS